MKTRIISAIIMAIICIPFVIIGGLPARILIGLIGILGYREFLQLKANANLPKLVQILGLISLVLLMFSNMSFYFYKYGLNFKYLIISLFLILLPVLIYFEKDTYSYKDAFRLFGFIAFFGITLNNLSNILVYQKAYFFLILLITILTDSFAYFIGVAFGKHKVTKISPKKSLEGYIGGIVLGTLVMCVYYAVVIGTSELYKVIPCILLMSLACEVGDLFYSAIKRQENVKDFSNLIPGHGGVLDRIDSLTFVTLTFMLLYGII